MSTKYPFFSIIIPTYNRAYCIGNAIQSVVDQIFTDWELIIIDDGSTDNTKSVVESFNDERINYYWQENQERSAARNNGIKMSKGEWICFQDSDDEYLNNHLMILHEGIIEHKNSYVLRTGLIMYGKKIPFYSKCPRFSCLPYSCFTTFAFHNSVVKKICFDLRFFIGEDLLFLNQVCSIYSLKILYNYTVVVDGEQYIKDMKYSNNFNKLIMNKIECFNEVISNQYKYKQSLPLNYFKNQIITSYLYGFYLSIKFGSIKYSYLIGALLFSIKNPITSLFFLYRFCWVKIGELLGFNYDGDCRF